MGRAALSVDNSMIESLWWSMQGHSALAITDDQHLHVAKVGSQSVSDAIRVDRKTQGSRNRARHKVRML